MSQSLRLSVKVGLGYRLGELVQRGQSSTQPAPADSDTDSCSSTTSSILMGIMATCLALTVQLHAVVSVTVCDFFTSVLGN